MNGTARASVAPSYNQFVNDPRFQYAGAPILTEDFMSDDIRNSKGMKKNPLSPMNFKVLGV